MNVTDNIKAIRKEKGLTQTEVAKRYGTSPEFYHRLEKKDKTLTIEQLEKIADALGVTVFEVLGYSRKSQEVDDLQKRLEDLNKDYNDLSAQNETLTNHNQTLFDQLKFFQDIIKGFMGNPEGLQKLIISITGGDETIIENIKQIATDSFPTETKQIEKIGQMNIDKT